MSYVSFLLFQILTIAKLPNRCVVSTTSTKKIALVQERAVCLIHNDFTSSFEYLLHMSQILFPYM